ncbi:MAG: hypothetical protein Q4E37_00075 [Tissierellia bacterium]|nr:hypothetical protein [Tissierellia bacterium]
MSNLILVRDMAGFYWAKHFMDLRKEEDHQLVYLPWDRGPLKDQGDLLDRLEGDRRFLISPGESLPGYIHWEDILGSLEGLKSPLYLGGPGPGKSDPLVQTPLLLNLAQDGYLERGYVAYILRDYLARAGDFEDLVLAHPALLGLKKPANRLAQEEGFRLVDPLENFLEGLDDLGGQGDQRFFWVVRDFNLERRLQEVFRFRPRFRLYHKHPWLRGEGLAKGKESKEKGGTYEKKR